MIIEISDNIPGKERKKLLKLNPVIYALNKFKNNRVLAAAWLGLSTRGLRRIIKRYNELSIFTLTPVEKYSIIKSLKNINSQGINYKETLYYRFATKEKRMKIDLIAGGSIEPEKN